MTTLSNETTVSKKLIDSVNEKKGSTWVSFEFFPPKTPAGVETLFQNITKLKEYNPLFADFTWGAGGSTSDLTMDLCQRALKETRLNPNMHLTCTGLDSKHLDDILDRCHAGGIQNILALRGDPPQGQGNNCLHQCDLHRILLFVFTCIYMEWMITSNSFYSLVLYRYVGNA